MARKRSRHKRLRDWFIYRALGGCLGALAYLCARGEREKTMRNLRLALGSEQSEEELESIARGMFAHFGRMAFEVIRLPRLSRRRVEKAVTFDGLEPVRRAIEAGRGVVVATGHIGNWELMGAAVARLGIPLNVIARRIYDGRLNDLALRLRERMGVKTILRESPESAKQILRCLRRGEMLALLIDQDIRVEGEFVPFFGMPAHTPTGAAALALRTGALLVAASAQRLDDGRHMVRAVPIVLVENNLLDHNELDAGGDRDRVIIEATARATAQLERWIRERPEQWSWNHDRWRTRPAATKGEGEGEGEDAHEGG